jgi:hypothetical protein
LVERAKKSSKTEEPGKAKAKKETGAKKKS